jgi:hypothetical protein
MVGLAVALFALLALAIYWRRNFLRERPIAIWERSFTGPTEATTVAAAAVGLEVERLPDGLEWVADLLLSPVWFFWGDIRTRRPARQLRRWRLVGRRGDRAARVCFGDNEVLLELGGTPASFWVVPPAQQPLVDQEGLRALLPSGSERWEAAAPILVRLFAAGVARIQSEGTALVARVQPGETIPLPRWGTIFDELAALLGLLERA